MWICVYLCIQFWNKNTSLAAQAVLAHRLQSRPRPIHDNANSSGTGLQYTWGDVGGLKKICSKNSGNIQKQEKKF